MIKFSERSSKSEIPPIASIVGKSGSGKTTLIEKLIPELQRMGFRVGTIKHDVHDFEMDHPGKDSWRHRQAGSVTTVISSPHRIGMTKDVDHDYALDELAPLLYGVDIILSEGYKREKKPKIEVFRPEVHSQPLSIEDESRIAFVTDAAIDPIVPRFDIDDITGIALFLIAHFSLKK
ncbi:MAG: molybdopterin-guanine dinucleotide biosynthesis protein B [Thermodesulfobacteriota bacterium]|nr:molybdopterin-guanine dinucleotide biosynthesis protein B [Thermodesulfobacteriota bacterium]